MKLCKNNKLSSYFPQNYNIVKGHKKYKPYLNIFTIYLHLNSFIFSTLVSNWIPNCEITRHRKWNVQSTLLYLDIPEEYKSNLECVNYQHKLNYINFGLSREAMWHLRLIVRREFLAGDSVCFIVCWHVCVWLTF